MPSTLLCRGLVFRQCLRITHFSTTFTMDNNNSILSEFKEEEVDNIINCDNSNYLNSNLVLIANPINNNNNSTSTFSRGVSLLSQNKLQYVENQQQQQQQRQLQKYNVKNT